MNRCRQRRGANAVEFALVMPVLVAMIAGVMEYGWFFSQRQVVVAAAREGARAGAVAGEDDDPVAMARARALDVLDDAALSADATVNAEVFRDGDWLLRVTVDSPYTPILNLVPTPERHGSVLTMRLEEQ